jgi:hypothetical protein
MYSSSNGEINYTNSKKMLLIKWKITSFYL